MPPDLDIDHKKPLRGTMPHYTQHIVISTGQRDWESRIEGGTIGQGQETRVNLARELKELIGPKGKYQDPRRSILISNSSMRNHGRTRGCDVSVYPEGYLLHSVGETPGSLEVFVEQGLMSSKLRPAAVERSQAFQSPQIMTKPTVFICGHKTRDSRCGVLGPILEEEFLRQGSKHAIINQGSKATNPETAHLLSVSHDDSKNGHSGFKPARSNMPFSVGLVSHVGGHAWAGNVIVYLPTNYRLADGTVSPLAAKGIWYGRVEPKHVEGIVGETMLKGRVIEELLRGVHSGKDAS